MLAKSAAGATQRWRTTCLARYAGSPSWRMNSVSRSNACAGVRSSRFSRSLMGTADVSMN